MRTLLACFFLAIGLPIHAQFAFDDLPFMAQARGTGGSGAFDANSIPNLQLWLDAGYGLANLQGATPTEGDMVYYVTNRATGGPNPFSAIAANSNSCPYWVQSALNGKPALRFGPPSRATGVSSASQSQPATYFLVFKVHSIENAVPWGSLNATPRFYFGIYNGNWNLYTDNGSDISLGTANTNWNIWACRLNAASTDYTFNSAAFPGTTVSGSPGSGGVNNPMWGNYYTLAYAASNSVAEALQYYRSLDDSEMGDVVRYLGNKYGITVE